MGTFFETLYDVLFQPRTAMRQAAAAPKSFQALAVVLLSSIIPIWAVYFGLKTSGVHNAFGVIVFLQLIGSLSMWVIGAALWHLIAEMFGGKGTALGLLSALGFAHLPRIFIVPLWVLAALMPAGIRPLVMGLTGLAIAVWVVCLDVTALKEAHGLSGAKAVLVFLVPPLAVLVVIIAVMIFMGHAFMRWPGL